MRFSLFKPPQAKTEPRPVLFRLSGLTHGEENFTVKAGAQRLAARLDLIVAALDSSPRGVDLAGESECQSALNIDPLTASNFVPPFFVVTEVVPVVHRRDPRCFV